MAVIADFSIPAIDFELGRALSMEEPVSIVLETLVPMGQRTVPFFWVQDHDSEGFERAVRDHEGVKQMQAIETHENRTLYAFRWHTDTDSLFEAFREANAQLLNASGHHDSWEFEIRFSNHKELSTFRDLCHDSDIRLTIDRVYHPTDPEAVPHYGLSEPQRKTLSTAVNQGFYSIPRQTSTKKLAAQFDISDQATTERLRRAIASLTEYTLLTEETDE